MIDINMDEGMLDSQAAMVKFLQLIASEPDISRVPVVLDSSKWSVIEAGLKCVQGKGVVNSISLKEGEEEFVRQATLVRRVRRGRDRHGVRRAGTGGHAPSGRSTICTRCYRILTERVGFPPEDIIFDPNIFAIGTGIEEHNDYAVDYIEATRRIKATLPHVLVSGGVSNVSFSFRGNDPVREAIHAVFLYHAIEAGMDMGIVNAGQLPIYSDIPADLLERVEDVVLNRRADATDRLLAVADQVKGQLGAQTADLAWREAPVHERLAHALVEGIADLRRRGHRGGPPPGRAADPGDRGPAHGGHEHRRRPVRRRQDVPAAGGEERARHEEGGRAPDPLHRGGAGVLRAWRRPTGACCSPR